MIKQVILAFALITLAVISCKKEDDTPSNSPGFNQGELLVNWGNNILLPSFSKYLTELKALDAQIQALDSSVSSSELQALQSQLNKTYLQWQNVSLFEMGPSADNVLKANTNTFPSDTAGIESKISLGDFDLTAASDLKKKGLPAMDYLLHGPKSMSTYFRIVYLKAISTDLYNISYLTNSEWTSYMSSFIGNTGNSAGSSMGLMLNAINLHLEKYHREAKIGIPNGERSFSGTPLPGNVEATYETDYSLSYAIENLRAIETMYLGTDINGNNGVGLEEYLNTLGAKYDGSTTLDAAVKNQFAACFSAYDQINVPLNQAVINNNQQVSNVFKEIQKLVVLFKVEIPAALNVQITYQDNDGD